MTFHNSAFHSQDSKPTLPEKISTNLPRVFHHIPLPPTHLTQAYRSRYFQRPVLQQLQPRRSGVSVPPPAFRLHSARGTRTRLAHARKKGPKISVLRGRACAPRSRPFKIRCLPAARRAAYPGRRPEAVRRARDRRGTCARRGHACGRWFQLPEAWCVRMLALREGVEHECARVWDQRTHAWAT